MAATSSFLDSPSGTPRYSRANTNVFRKQTTAKSSLGPAASILDAGLNASEQEDAYFSELLSYSLERLSKEPELLKADQDHLRQEAQESAVAHYHAFIDTADCLDQISAEIQTVAENLESLSTDMASLGEVCSKFTEGATSILGQRAANKLLHSNHATLLELLEVPQLMDTCVRNGNYDEALDLRAFVGKLAFMHPDLAAVKNLLKEVNGISQAMLQQLLQKLKSNIQLPECLRVIGYLRRLAAFSERDLRLRFLHCREEWLGELVDELEESNAYEYLKRLTDLHRLHLFDIIMQYRAIFSDDTSSQEAQLKDGGILYAWAQHRMSLYLTELQKHLPKISEGGSLVSVLEHCMYCGMSLGRVGLDFRGLLPPVFETCVVSLFTKSVQQAVDTFSLVLESHKWVAMPSMAGRARTASTQDGWDKDAHEDMAPPYALMEHPPLAILTNGLLSAFNELRHCAPLSLSQPLANLVQKALEQAVAIVVHYSATRVLNETELALFVASCKAMQTVVCPYIAACFSRVYLVTTASIDVAAVVEPLKEVLEHGMAELQ